LKGARKRALHSESREYACKGAVKETLSFSGSKRRFLKIDMVEE